MYHERGRNSQAKRFVVTMTGRYTGCSENITTSTSNLLDQNTLRKLVGEINKKWS